MHARSVTLLWDPMDCSPPGYSALSIGFPREEHWGGLPFLSPGDLPVSEASTWDPTHDRVMRRRPDKQGRSGLQEFRKPAPALTLKMISVFLMLAILDYSLISGTQVGGLPRSLSKQNQLRTLISMSPGRRYAIRLSRMKAVFQFRPLCWHSSLLGKCILMHMTAHNTSVMNSIKNLISLKALIGTEPFGGWGSPIREHKTIILKVVRIVHFNQEC